MGAVERGIIEAAIRRRQPLPERVQNAPTLLPGLELFYIAFLELSTCRHIGFVSGPIPWTAVDAYATRHRYDDELRTELEHHIHAMDEAYLKYWEKKRGIPGGSQSSADAHGERR